MRASWRWPRLVLVAVSLLVSACAGGEPTPQRGSQQSQSQPQTSGRTKHLNVGVTGGVQALSIVGSSSPTGGFFPFSEVHSDGLITADVNTHKAVGRLAEKVPSVDDGSVSMLPDGKMRVSFSLRKGVTWHDGAPFTARDMTFAFAMGGPDGFPTALNTAAEHIASVEAPDDYTFVVNYRQPYYLATALGPNMLWPLPRHLLSETFERYLASRNPDDVLQLPYWTTEYVHLGAFRLTQFDPGQGLTFEAYDRYFLGRPKIDTIRVTIFSDQNTLMASILAGAIDLVPESGMREATGVPLRDQWKLSGEGTVHVQQASLRRIVPQVRPALQSEPANLDPRAHGPLPRPRPRGSRRRGWGRQSTLRRLVDSARERPQLRGDPRHAPPVRLQPGPREGDPPGPRLDAGRRWGPAP